MSGLEFPDDGRGAARVDWDHDGDLDLWTSNRTGPQLRMLRNEISDDNRFLAFSLRGTTCNRDAVGARVELTLAHNEGNERKLIRTLRAGEGFLSQSSKWLHFGVGRDEKVKRLVVRWPGGEAEEFADIETGHHYRIVQGQPLAQLWRHQEKPTVRPAAEAEPSDLPATNSEVVQVYCYSRVPLPKMNYQTLAGEIAPVFHGRGSQPGRPVLLNLWATWCPPCVDELKQFEKHQSELRAAGLDVVAISVDPIDPTNGATVEEVAVFVERLNLSYAVGLANAPTIEKLQMVHDMTFDFHQQLPLPTSLLIDDRGRLAGIYKGSVSPPEIIEAVSELKKDDASRRRASLPFAGRWFAEPRRLNIFNLAIGLLEEGYYEEGVEFFVENSQQIKTHPRYPRLLVLIGEGAEKQGRYSVAKEMYTEARTVSPNNLLAGCRLAVLLATCPDERLRNIEEAVILAEAIAQQTRHTNLDAIYALFVVYLTTDNHDAARRVGKEALTLAKSQAEVDLASQIEARLKQLD